MSLSQRLAPPLAISTLAKVMAIRQAPHSARVSASAVALKFSRESIELDDVQDACGGPRAAGAEQAREPP